MFDLPTFIYVDSLIRGLLQGAVYGMMAIGLSIVFGVMKVVNFAHGEMLILGGYLAFMLYSWFALDPIIAIALIGPLMFAFGAVLQRTLVDKFIDRPQHQQFLLMIGMALVLVNGLDMIFGPDARGAHEVPYAFDSYEVGGIFIDAVRLYKAAAALVMVGFLFWFFKATRTGKAIRAAADNYRGALVVGLNVSRLYAITFGIGAACAGAAGCLLVLDDITPHAGPGFTLLAFTIVIIGGLGSMPGALLGGVLIGVSEAMAGVMFQPSLKSIFSYGLLILVLLFRPAGLMGKRA
ncbi:MAG: branched-chain amino acid ABC transporter permease [Azospirillaceae bacterium]